MESNYFGATTVKFPALCNHCGGVSGAPLVNDDKLQRAEKAIPTCAIILRILQAIWKGANNMGGNACSSEKKSPLRPLELKTIMLFCSQISFNYIQ